MLLTHINPYIRYVQLQPAVLEGEYSRMAYDYRLFYMVDGEGALLLNKEEYALSPGSVIYLRPCVPYMFTGKLKCIVINFDLTRNQEHLDTPITPAAEENFRKSRVFENDPPEELQHFILLHNQFQLEPLFRDIFSCKRFKKAYSDAHASGILKELLCLVLQNTTEQPQKNTELVQQILIYIKKNYDKDLQNTEIAATFGYHPFYLNRIFKECTGQTLHQTVLNERLRIAKKLLANTHLPIESVAMESGFTDRSQFGTTFKKCTGMSPATYRQQKNKEQ